MADNRTPLLRSLPFIIALSAPVPTMASWSIENDLSTSDKHGLFEIREEARRFISKENAKGFSNGTYWSPT
ncbi:hypothetical protein J2W42_006025 [Rhizobium tibeticum]|nr:hypothetical protein [Rhizobium tibeticum]